MTNPIEQTIRAQWYNDSIRLGVTNTKYADMRRAYYSGAASVLLRLYGKHGLSEAKVWLEEINKYWDEEVERCKASLGRPDNYLELSPEEQWEVDKKLGILDWEG